MVGGHMDWSKPFSVALGSLLIRHREFGLLVLVSIASLISLPACASKPQPRVEYRSDSALAKIPCPEINQTSGQAAGSSTSEQPCNEPQEKPVLLSRPEPPYPAEARDLGLADTVIVKVLVGCEGRVLATRLLQGRYPMLNNAALEAARSAVFRPGRNNCKTVRVWMAIGYRFGPDE